MTMTSRNQCPICTEVRNTPIFSKNGFDLVRCLKCQHIFVCPMPTDAELVAHYQNPSYFSGEEAQGYQNYADMERVLLPISQRRIAKLDQQMPRKGHILDFGCASGYFLQVASNDGWQIHAVELSNEMAALASERLKIPVVTSLEMLTQDHLDAVTLWEVIEHLPRPVEELRKIAGYLRPGGALMLSTPNTGHWQALRDPNRWEGYRPPSHLQFFTRQTLISSLTQAGFENIQIQGTAPLPPLPGWLERMSMPLYRSLATGQAEQWKPALYTWRAIRLFGWLWQKIRYPQDDIFATLEVIAFRSK